MTLTHLQETPSMSTFDHVGLIKDINNNLAPLRKAQPDAMQAFGQLAGAAMKEGTVSAKHKELIAGYVPEDQRTPSQKKKHQYRLGLIDQIVKADEILLASPMWNWNVPSVLKAYIDQLIVPGFFDNNTKKLAGKKITVALACGGSYSPDSWHPEWDYETGYLKHIFTALGSTDVEVIRTEWCLAGIVPGMEAYTALKEESFRDAKIAAQKRAQSPTASSKWAGTQQQKKQQHQQQEFYEVGCSCVIA